MRIGYVHERAVRLGEGVTLQQVDPHCGERGMFAFVFNAFCYDDDLQRAAELMH